MQKDRDEIGKSLVKRQNVGIGREPKTCAHPIEQSMCCLVGNNVVRKAGEDASARKIAAVRSIGVEVAEIESSVPGVVVGVLSVNA